MGGVGARPGALAACKGRALLYRNVLRYVSLVGLISVEGYFRHPAFGRNGAIRVDFSIAAALFRRDRLLHVY